MKLKTTFLIPVLLFFMPGSAFSQTSIFDKAETLENYNLLCLIEDAYKLSMPWNGQAIRIFEGGENHRISSESGGKRHYYFMPLVEISDFSIDTAGTPAWINLTIKFIHPGIMDVHNYIYKINSHFTSSHVTNPLCCLGLRFSLPGGHSSEIETGAGMDLIGTLPVRVEFEEKKKAIRSFKSIKQGNPVKMEIVLNTGQSASCGFDVKYEDITQSSAYREFLSPVKGNTIWIGKKQLAEAMISQELEGRFYRELGECPDANTYEWLKKAATLDYREKVITFEEITNGSGAATNLEDIEKNNRYATDVTRRIAIDAKKLNKESWCKKYSSQLKTNLEKYRHSGGGGGGKLEVFGFFKVHGRGVRKTKEELIKEYESIINQEDCGKKFFEDSFKYEKEGEKFEPKGIIANEVINSESEARSKFNIRMYLYSNQYRVETFFLTKKTKR